MADCAPKCFGKGVGFVETASDKMARVQGKARARCTTRCNDAVCANVYVDVPGDSLGPA